jgi:hypothetical protein
VSHLVVNVHWTDLVSLAFIRQVLTGLDCEEGGLEFLGSSGRITVCGDYCSVFGNGGCDGAR